MKNRTGVIGIMGIMGLRLLLCLLLPGLPQAKVKDFEDNKELLAPFVLLMTFSLKPFSEGSNLWPPGGQPSSREVQKQVPIFWQMHNTEIFSQNTHITEISNRFSRAKHLKKEFFPVENFLQIKFITFRAITQALKDIFHIKNIVFTKQ